MRYLISASLAFLLLGATAAVAVEKTVKLSVRGMSCISCAYSAEKALRSVDGVKDAMILGHKKMALVTYDDAKCNVGQLVSAVEEVGFPTKLIETTN